MSKLWNQIISYSHKYIDKYLCESDVQVYKIKLWFNFRPLVRIILIYSSYFHLPCWSSSIFHWHGLNSSEKKIFSWLNNQEWMIFLIKFLKVVEHIFSAKLNLGIFSYLSDHLNLQLVSTARICLLILFILI